ncbi:MAG TPA: hypothetical protein DEQ38_11810 [Elusimicrobia bacterium]|nr:hypothetical protein [Elusimicrobiota bacterium]
MERKLLLLVDDEEDWTCLLQGFLSSQGYSVLCASSCLEALVLVRQHNPRCVILDLNLGKENGADLCCLLKSSPECKDMRVIILSGSDDVPRDCRCDAVICKADGIDRILAALKKVLGEDNSL